MISAGEGRVWANEAWFMVRGHSESELDRLRSLWQEKRLWIIKGALGEEGMKHKSLLKLCAGVLEFNKLNGLTAFRE